MALFIIIAIMIILITYVILKPYFIKYHTTLLFTGELGAGKTLNAVKTAVKQFKKILFQTKLHNWYIRQLNKIIKLHNKRIEKYNKKQDEYIEQGVSKKIIKYKNKWIEREQQELPRLISNIPIRYKSGRNPKWSNVLEKEMLTLQPDNKGYIKKIPEHSIIVMDEVPQIIDQYNWNLKIIQENFNELITFFRHYVDGLIIMTAQADSQVVKQLRDKMNQFYWLSNYRKFLFKFYKCDICQFLSSDVVKNVNTGFIEDNTKTIYGIHRKGLYDSRCYSIRYTELPPYNDFKVWCQFKTGYIIRFDDYDSPLDKKGK